MYQPLFNDIGIKCEFSQWIVVTKILYRSKTLKMAGRIVGTAIDRPMLNWFLFKV